MDRPFLSVVLPVYNVEAFLPTTIPSILNQSFTDFELIIVNDSTKDNSLEICEEFAKKDSRIKVFSQKNQGVGGARNTGIKKALSEIIVFVDSDDILNFDMLKCLAKPFQENPDCLLSACNFKNFNDKVEYSSDTFEYNKITPYEFFYSGKNREGCTIFTTAWAKACKKSLFRHIKFPKHKYHEDVFITCRLLYAAKYVYYSEYPGYFYRKSNPNSITKIPSKKRQVDYMHGQVFRLWYLRNRERKIFQKYFDFYVKMFSNTNLQNRAFRNVILLIPYTQYSAKRKFKFFVQFCMPVLHKILGKLKKFYGMMKNDSLRKQYAIEKKISRIRKAKISYGLNKTKRKEHVVVSFTTYPKRFIIAKDAIKSLFLQSVKPDRIIMYTEVHRNQIIPEILEFEKYGLEIVCESENLGPHNKYFNAIRDFPESHVITVDDDAYYTKDLVKSLLKTNRRYPTSVCARRVHKVLMNSQGSYEEYMKWSMDYKELTKPVYGELLATGVGGVLYPPHCMPETTFSKEKIKALCLYQDDIWLYFNELYNHTSVVWVKNKKPLPPLHPEHYDEALSRKNCCFGENDKCIEKVSQFFGSLK